MPSNRKGWSVQYVNHLVRWGSLRWNWSASQRTKRQALSIARDWRLNGFEVRVLTPEKEVYKHWPKKG